MLILYILLLIFQYYHGFSYFLKIFRKPLQKHKLYPLFDSTGPIIEIRNFTSIPHLSPDEMEYKMDALHMLDCLTCPIDEDDPGYDVEKDIERDELIINTDYSDLKVELRARGLRTTGDKLEMIIRLLLHVIDPSVQYEDMTGRESNLKYVDAKDLEGQKIRLVPESERNKEDSGPDAEDLAVLRKKFVTSPSNTVGGMASKKYKAEKPKVVMDGLSRREVAFPLLHLTKPRLLTAHEDRDNMIDAYIVGGRDVLRTWEKISPVVVMIPDEAGWKNKENRIFADEIAFYNQAIVIIPSLDNHDVIDRYELFDHIVSTIRFARVEYNSKAVSLAGIGTGGGHALTIAAELAQFSDKEILAKVEKANLAAQRNRAIIFESEEPLYDLSLSDSEGDDSAMQPVLPPDLDFLDAVSSADPEPHFIEESLPTLPSFINAPKGIKVTKPSRIPLLPDASLNAEQLHNCIPCGLFVVSPSNYKVDDVGGNIISSLFAVFGEKDATCGSKLRDAEDLHDLLVAREKDIKDFSFRIYEGRQGPFLHRSASDDDKKCAQEALALGAMWLDIFSRDQEDDPTECTGETKLTESFRYIRLKELVTPLRPTTIATYLHDDPLFNN